MQGTFICFLRPLSIQVPIAGPNKQPDFSTFPPPRDIQADFFKLLLCYCLLWIRSRAKKPWQDETRFMQGESSCALCTMQEQERRKQGFPQVPTTNYFCCGQPIINGEMESKDNGPEPWISSRTMNQLASLVWNATNLLFLIKFPTMETLVNSISDQIQQLPARCNQGLIADAETVQEPQQLAELLKTEAAKGNACKQTHANARLHNSAHLQKHIHTHTLSLFYTHTHTNTHTHTHTHTDRQAQTHIYTQTHTHTSTHTRTNTQTHTYTHKYTHGHTSAHTHTHTYTHTKTCTDIYMHATDT